jgi:hypothetical protein
MGAPMYVPPAFAEESLAAQHAVIRAHAFGAADRRGIASGLRNDGETALADLMDR